MVNLACTGKVTYLRSLSHDVASVSDVTPCNKIDKPPVVLRNDVHDNDSKVWTFSLQRCDDKVILMSCDKYNLPFALNSKIIKRYKKKLDITWISCDSLHACL